jgi:hypothetical protein
MSDVSLAIVLSYSKNGREFILRNATTAFDATGDGLASGVITATEAAAVAVPLGSVASPGLAVFQNLDDTNFIELGYDSTGFVAAMQIPAGGVAIVYLDGLLAAPYVQADTADALLSYTIIEE